MSGMMQKMSGLGMMDRMKAMSQLGQAGMFNPGANLKQQKERSKRGPADQKLADEKRKKARKESKKQKKRNR
jgi:signal recognition particle subunit SRP54